MYRKLKCDKDTYITNRIINGTRVTDANVGLAGTLDLFKLYNETNLSGSSEVIELSRILLHFNLDPLRELTGSILDLSNSSLKAKIKLYDIFGGQTIPSNFTLIAYPLSKSFDEGNGFDISQFRDLDTANYLTASDGNIWNEEGANAKGLLGSSDIDIIESGNVGSGLQNLFVTQNFTIGTENLELDVTNIISATLTQQIPDYGFRISFSGTQETDSKSRFVKRFTSRHANDPALRPSLEVYFNDALQDDHRNFYFDVSGTLFLNNYQFGQLSNIIYNGSEITGSDSLALTIVSGSGSTYYEKILTASQYSVSDIYQSGVYFSTFAIGTNENSALQNEIRLAGSGTFTEIWGSLDGIQGFYTGSLVINSSNRTAFNNVPPRYYINVINNQGTYKSTEKVRFHIFIRKSLERVVASKLPLERKSNLFTNCYYQIIDSNSGKIHIPFEEDNNGTLMSVNDNGMYFDLYMSDLYMGRNYAIEVKLTDFGNTIVFDKNKVGAVFTVIP